MRRILVATAAVVFAAGCFGPNPNLTESGLAKPVVTLEFPQRVDAGSTTELTVNVTNPGPGEMTSFSIAFLVVAVGGGRGNAQSLVAPAPAPERLGTEQEVSPSIASIEPTPVDVGESGLVFRFGPLGEEESASVGFEIVAPTEPGNYANSLQVYDSRVIDRIGAVKLETEVVR